MREERRGVVGKFAATAGLFPGRDGGKKRRRGEEAGLGRGEGERKVKT